MNARLARNLIAGLVVVLILSLMLAFGGCAYYSVTKTPNEVKITAISWRQMDAPYIDYYRNGDDRAGFTFSADAITSPSLRDLNEVVIGLSDSLGIGKQTMLGVVGYCNQHPVMCTR
jgi:hypothetical protein